MAALESFLAEEVRPLAGVERVSVEVALSTAKETALLPVAPVPPDEDE